MKILELNNITKKFGDFIAVDNISLSVKEGEIFGFLGPNGAGKSTTINIICGLLKANEGEIKILGNDYIKNSKASKLNIGVVPQDLAIYPELSAYENVSFFAGLYGLRGRELNDKVIEALQFVELLEKKDSRAKNFSGGMKRRLNIACAIAHNPKLIIMDEPTVGIDPQSRNYILESVKKLNKMGSTIIYTSHYMEEVEEICTRVAIIEHGKIIADGTKEELKSIVTDTNIYNIRVNSVNSLDISQMENIEGVISVEINENNLNINTKAEVNILNKIISLLIEKNIEIKNIETKIPTLETVFLTLTGRKLRDE